MFVFATTLFRSCVANTVVASVEAGEKAINVELSTTETYREVIPSIIQFSALLFV